MTNQKESDLIYVFSAISLAIAGTAIYFTGFITVFAPTLLLLFLIHYRYRPKFEFRAIALPLLFVLFSFVALNAKYFWGGEMNLMAQGDKSFYAQVSAFLKSSGIESYYFDYVNTADRHPIPYHYGENWTTVLFSCIFGLNEFFTQELITTPILFGLSIYFLFNTCRLQGMNLLVSILLPIAAIFFTGIPGLDYAKLPVFGEMISQFQIDPLSYTKHLFSIMCSAMFIYSLALNKWRVSLLSVMISLFAFLCSISFITVFSASFLFYFLQRDKKKKVDYLYYLTLLITIFYFILFYFVLSSFSKSSNYSATDLSLFGSCISIPIYLKTIFNIVVKSSIQLFIIFAPFFIIYFFSRKEAKRNSLKIGWLPFLGILFSGLLLWGVFWFSMGSISLFSDAAFWLFKLFLILMLPLVLKDHSNIGIKNLLLIISFAYVLLSLNSLRNAFLFNNQQVTPEFILTTDKLGIDPAIPFVYLRLYDTDGPDQQKNLLANPSIGFISNLNCKQEGIFVDINNIKPGKDCLSNYREKPLINTSAYALYLNKNKGVKADECIHKFVSENKIRFIIKDKNYPSENSLIQYLPTKQISSTNSYEVLEIVDKDH